MQRMMGGEKSSSNPESLTLRPEVSFQTTEIPPPAPFYVSREDIAFIRLFNSSPDIVVGLRLRILLPNGEIKPNHYSFRPTSNRLANDFSIKLPESYLVGASFIVEKGTVRRGQLYCILGFQRGLAAFANLFQVLISAPLTSGGALTWPGSIPVASTEGGGHLRTVVGTDPPPGNQISETVPTNARWRVLAIRFVLATSAVTATRRVQLSFNVGGNIIYSLNSGDTQAASTTITYNWIAGQPIDIPTALGQIIDPIPPFIFLKGGDMITTFTLNMQSGDNFSAPTTYVEEWLDP
mgnify:CR=1 FL=1